MPVAAALILVGLADAWTLTTFIVARQYGAPDGMHACIGLSGRMIASGAMASGAAVWGALAEMSPQASSAAIAA